MARLARLLGAATAVFGAATAARPEIIARPLGLTEEDGTVPPRTRLLIELIGFRDVAVGAGMVVAPRGAPLRWLIAARAVSDAGDAFFLGRSLPSPVSRVLGVAMAGGWAVLCAASAVTAGRPEAPVRRSRRPGSAPGR
ncbi:hypothetical protein CDO52_25985 [Nocardiopsis gilva YIM 90087]|uniref:DUF4267 domain-containing protein n=1 Tax=Nocardiopsis gilva YIM 90087 TaxID=1235441 RepID=A0A223SCG3_9ACTN|nr:hypothetical protein [Nocardiopsis gilva]ASU85790.1 hypothetical protein CDO52_25985 [Nocardiopsis gilva YIM 90087]